ncbi:G-type lectin S-receptor-like serine/threonine-protein kinase At4g03230 [Linum grandiflorum]
MVPTGDTSEYGTGIGRRRLSGSRTGKTGCRIKQGTSVSLLTETSKYWTESVNHTGEKQGIILWQSFDHPTDTFLSGMEMVPGFNLASWTSPDDPSPGNYMFQLDDQQSSENQQQPYVILNNSKPFWNSGGQNQIPPFITQLLMNSPIRLNLTSLNISTPSPVPASNYSTSRFLMGFDGRIQFFPSPIETEPWWVEPNDICDLTSACGSFGSCNSGYRWPCKCLPGFEPRWEEKWNAGDFSDGCISRSSTNSQNCEKNSSIFFNLTVAKVQRPTTVNLKLDKEVNCSNLCLDQCSCQAYSFRNIATKSEASGCKIWTDDDLQGIEEFDGNLYDGGVRLKIRAHIPNIEEEMTKKDCKPCGINIIPYPLSTGPNCGDPTYSSFICNAITGQFVFITIDRNYTVTRIEKRSRKFFIRAGKENCGKKAIGLDQSLPFKIHEDGCNDDMSNVSFGPFHDGKSFYEMAIVWDSPQEPLCSTDDDCKIWPNSSCRSKVGYEKRCICDGSSRWNGIDANCTQIVGLSTLSQYETRRSLMYPIIFGCIGGVLLISGFAFLIVIYMRKTGGTMRNKGKKNEENLALRMYDSEKRVKEFINSGNEFGEDDKRDINVPFFDLDCILAATDFFSIDNKLGQGGFGPVYKGKFPGGQEIAVKRLSSASAQGLEEFKNEVVLIAKLQHKNLVRLLGYCVEGNEKMLLYEYMPNKSLDFFIFDRSRCVLLDWNMRFNIIMGIARGLLYLHHDSRLTIIHRDLKTSNILLDEEMNPRISDFGMARIMGGKETEANTVKVVGTYGYMSPEYALDGNFSIKSDVFSFGVVLLEIISGKRNTGFYKSNKVVSLLGHVWGYWREEKAMEVMDQSLSETCVAHELLRCVNVALLCVQEDPNDRPTMANVLFMLGSDAASLGRPKEPAFSIRREISSSTSSSIVTMETTVLEAR